MEINLNTPIVTPPIQSVTYTNLKLTNFSFSVDPNGQYGSLTFTLLPSTNNGELAPITMSQTTTINNFYPCLNQTPELENAYSGVLNAIPALINWAQNNN